MEDDIFYFTSASGIILLIVARRKIVLHKRLVTTRFRAIRAMIFANEIQENRPISIPIKSRGII